MMKPAKWMLAALLLVGAAGCGSDASREERPFPAMMLQAASDDPRLPEGAVRTLDLNDLPGRCEVVATCGDLVGVDCASYVDGPFYYVEKSTGRIVEYCGGSCMAPEPGSPYCRNCPALGWTCDDAP